MDFVPIHLWSVPGEGGGVAGEHEDEKLDHHLPSPRALGWMISEVTHLKGESPEADNVSLINLPPSCADPRENGGTLRTSPWKPLFSFQRPCLSCQGPQ